MGETGSRGPVSFSSYEVVAVKRLAWIAAAIILPLALMAGCDTRGHAAAPAPQRSPEETVLRFFSLLSEGGKLTTMEAYRMVSARYGEIDPDQFRKWTQDFTGEARVKVSRVAVADKPNAKGDMVAMVDLEVNTPSLFDEPLVTTSKMNLILDPKANEWKIDFMADTIDETTFKSAPAEARPGEPLTAQP